MIKFKAYYTLMIKSAIVFPLIFGAVGSSFGGTFNITDTTNKPFGDTIIHQSFPANNYSSEGTSYIGRSGTPTGKRGLFGTDLSSIPSGSVINSAYLYIFVSNKSQYPTIEAYRITTDWDVEDVTWNTRPSYNLTLLDSNYINGANIWWSWDVKPAVEYWVANPANNYGVILRIDDETIAVEYDICIRTSNYADHKPYFSIVYTPPITEKPTLYNITPNPSYDGSYLVDWSDVSGANDYEVQENGVTVGYPPSSNWPVSGKSNGPYSYKVRGRNVAGSGPWSDPKSVTVDLDTVNPTPPTSIIDALNDAKTLGISNNTWQNITAKPFFKWTGYGDDKSGVAGFNWSLDTNQATVPGTSWPPQVTTNEAESGTDPGSNGVYYFRVRTFDNVQHYSAPSSILFTVKYDGSAPNNPSAPCNAWKSSSKTISIPNDTWQTDTANPYFEWDIPTDVGGSGFKGFYYYYGTNSGGEPANWTTNNYYDAGADPGNPGTYYLRIKTEDNADNISSPITLFTVMYDGPPNITDLAAKTESTGSLIPESTWQSDNDPYFYWSEPASASAIEGYSWAWNGLPNDNFDDPPGTNTFYQCTDDSVNNGQHTFYIKAKNNIGWGSTDSFEIWIDTTPPGQVAAVRDGVGSDVARTDFLDRLSANWDTTSDSESGMDKYWVAIGTFPGGTSVMGWQDVGISISTETYLSLTSGSTYYFSVKAENKAGLQSQITSSNGQLAEPTPPIGTPSTPTCDDCSKTATITFSWTQGTAGDPESGIAGYYLQVGTSSSPFTWDKFSYDVGNVLTENITGCDDEKTYYARVRARNGAGLYSNYSGVSKGILVKYSANTVPTLSWTGETNYTSDGLNPESGDISTNFVFRISYSDVDNDKSKSGYPRVHIKKGGTEITGSPFAMDEVDSGDTIYTDGKFYTYSLTLTRGVYTYYFEVYDIFDDKATGEPTDEKSGPAVIGKPPKTKEMKVYHGVFKSGENEKCYVSFNLEQAGETTIKVYNSLGREVKELYRGTANLGLNTISWDGTDENGSKVSSGVYIIRIEGPGIKQQKRVVVVR